MSYHQPRFFLLCIAHNSWCTFASMVASLALILAQFDDHVLATRCFSYHVKFVDLNFGTIWMTDTLISLIPMVVDRCFHIKYATTCDMFTQMVRHELCRLMIVVFHGPTSSFLIYFIFLEKPALSWLLFRRKPWKQPNWSLLSSTRVDLQKLRKWLQIFDSYWLFDNVR